MDVVVGAPSAPVITAFGALTADTSIAAANNRRSFVTIFNGLDVTLYVLLGSGTVSTTNYSFKLTAGQYWEAPGAGFFRYKGAIKGIQSGGAAGQISVQEWVD